VLPSDVLVPWLLKCKPLTTVRLPSLMLVEPCPG
jgi:hypothetical protein